MGTLTLSEFRDELLVSLKQRTDLTDAQLNRWINMAYLHLCTPEVRQHKEVETSYSFPLVSGTNVYNIDAATVGYHILGIKQVTYYEGTLASYTNRWHLRPRDENWFYRRLLSTNTAPRHYLWRGTQLTLNPIPGTAHTGNIVELLVWREPALLSGDTDTTVLTAYWDHALILGAQWIAEQRLGLRELSIATQQLYAQYINEKAGGGEWQAQDTGFVMEIESEPYQ